MGYGGHILRKMYEVSPVSLQNLFTSSYGYHLKKKKYGKHFDAYSAFLQTFQWASEKEIREYQNHSVQAITSWAYDTVPYYRALFDSLGEKPNSLQTVEDLKRLPILGKDTIRTRSKEFISAQYPRKQITVYHTSGTTGKPLTVCVSQNCFEREYAFRWLHYSWAGIHRGDRIATFAGHPVVPVLQQHPPYWRMNRAENQLIFSSQHISRATLPFYITALKEFKPQMIHGYPSSLYLIAKYINNRHVQGIEPKGVFTASETLLSFQRQALEEAFHCKVFNWYGNTEMTAHAVECGCGSLHIQPTHSVFELVDAEGSSVSAGNVGVVVGTGFDNLAMPLIRYKVGDSAVGSKGKCTCGRVSECLGDIQGRVEDYIVTPDGRFVGRLDHVFKADMDVVSAQLIQESVNRLTVRIVRGESYADKHTRKIAQELRGRLGNSMALDFDFVHEIPRNSSGKFSFVVSKLAATQSVT